VEGAQGVRGLSYSHKAQDDLVAVVHEVVGREGEVAAEAALARLLALCDDLARFPEMGRRRPELDAFGLPVCTMAENGRLIVYARRGNMLLIARILRDV